MEKWERERNRGSRLPLLAAGLLAVLLGAGCPAKPDNNPGGQGNSSGATGGLALPGGSPAMAGTMWKDNDIRLEITTALKVKLHFDDPKRDCSTAEAPWPGGDAKQPTTIKVPQSGFGGYCEKIGRIEVLRDGNEALFYRVYPTEGGEALHSGTLVKKTQ